MCQWIDENILGQLRERRKLAVCQACFWPLAVRWPSDWVRRRRRHWYWPWRTRKRCRTRRLGCVLNSDWLSSVEVELFVVRLVFSVVSDAERLAFVFVNHRFRLTKDIIIEMRKERLLFFVFAQRTKRSIPSSLNGGTSPRSPGR